MSSLGVSTQLQISKVSLASRRNVLDIKVATPLTSEKLMMQDVVLSKSPLSGYQTLILNIAKYFAVYCSAPVELQLVSPTAQPATLVVANMFVATAVFNSIQLSNLSTSETVVAKIVYS